MRKMITAVLLCIAAQAGSVASADEPSRQLSPKEAIFGVKQNMSCGLPPLPPLGCKVGPCMCDASGGNCQWTFICS